MQAAAPTIVTRLKNAGVTTIVPFTGAADVQALMETASKQDYFPEWFFTGASYQDIGILARNYPPEQGRHAFGISFINPSNKKFRTRKTSRRRTSSPGTGVMAAGRPARATASRSSGC